MEILRGSPALSAFRITRLLALFVEKQLPVTDIYAEYMHFAEVSAPLSDGEQGKLSSLQYGLLWQSTTHSVAYFSDSSSGNYLSMGLQKQQMLHNCGLNPSQAY